MTQIEFKAKLLGPLSESSRPLPPLNKEVVFKGRLTITHPSHCSLESEVMSAIYVLENSVIVMQWAKLSLKNNTASWH